MTLILIFFLILSQDFAILDQATTDCGYTALHTAAMKGYPGVARMLLDARADPDIVTNHFNPTQLAEGNVGHRNALHLAVLSHLSCTCPCEHNEVMRMLVKQRQYETALWHEADVHASDQSGRTPLDYAVMVEGDETKACLAGKESEVGTPPPTCRPELPPLVTPCL